MFRRVVLRPVFAFAAVALVALAVAACGGSKNSSSSSGSSGSAASASNSNSGSAKGKKVYLLTCGNNVPYCARLGKLWPEEFSKYGVETTILTDEFSAAEEAAHINEAVSQKANEILWEGNAQEAAHAPLLKAKQAGIPVLLIGTAPEPPVQGLYTSYLGPSDVRMGEMQAEILVEGLKKAAVSSGDIMLVTGTKGTIETNEEQQGWEKVIKKYPQYKVVAEPDGQFEPIKAGQVSQPILAKYGSSMVGVAVESGSMAAAVVKTAEQAGLKPGIEKGDLIVEGNNCDGTSIKAIEAGTLFATTNQGPVSEGTAAVKPAIEVLEGKTIDTRILTPNIPIYKTNVSQYAQECTY